MIYQIYDIMISISTLELVSRLQHWAKNLLEMFL